MTIDGHAIFCASAVLWGLLALMDPRHFPRFWCAVGSAANVLLAVATR